MNVLKNGLDQPHAPGQFGAEAGVGRGLRARGLRQLVERRQDLLRHLRRARVHDRDAVLADRRRDVGAIRHEHVDVALHRQHVHLAVFRDSDRQSASRRRSAERTTAR